MKSDKAEFLMTYVLMRIESALKGQLRILPPEKLEMFTFDKSRPTAKATPIHDMAGVVQESYSRSFRHLDALRHAYQRASGAHREGVVQHGSVVPAALD